MFSLNRVYASAILPEGEAYTFWGKGVSQGHSDAVRRVEGVKDARQYTIPVPEALDAVRSGSNPTLTTRQKHTREVFAVAEEGADLDRIREEIVTMPNYFDEYDTTVHFIDEETLQVRRVQGVIDARQYTIPVPVAVDAVRSGSNPTLSTRKKHTREVFAVAE